MAERGWAYPRYRWEDEGIDAELYLNQFMKRSIIPWGAVEKTSLKLVVSALVNASASGRE